MGREVASMQLSAQRAMEASMKNVLRAIQIALVVVGLSAVPVLTRASQTEIRFCCTPQQSAACTAQGGTPSCRTNICQCLF